MRAPAGETVDLLGISELIDRHATEALCEDSWEAVRVDERRRAWTLTLLVRFWTAVTLDPPPSLRHALSESAGGAPLRYARAQASPQAFFARCQDLRWEFFREVWERFSAGIRAEAPPTFCGEISEVLGRFAAVEAVDGSDLDAVARRLKAVRREDAVVLPGALLAFLDLRQGVLSRLIFDPAADRAEFSRVLGTLGGVAEGTLLVGDRLYGVPKLFEALSERGLFGLARRFSPVAIREERLLSRRREGGQTFEDLEVLAGTGQTAAAQRLRLIRAKKGGAPALELLTNVLDPRRLSAPEAAALYRRRWEVERLFSDLKCVVKLNRFYAANTNAIGMQVYAAAMVHTALRVAQARAAEKAGIPPEEIFPRKFFPKAAAAASAYAAAEWMFEQTRRANRGVTLAKPSLRRAPFASTTLASVRVERRKPGRGRKRRPTVPYGVWISLPPPKARRNRRPLS